MRFSSISAKFRLVFCLPWSHDFGFTLFIFDFSILVVAFIFSLDLLNVIFFPLSISFSSLFLSLVDSFIFYFLLLLIFFVLFFSISNPFFKFISEKKHLISMIGGKIIKRRGIFIFININEILG